MSEDPVAISLSSTVGDAVQILQDLQVRHLPVINTAREVVGMLSDRDLRALSIPRTIEGEWRGAFRIALETDVAQIMSSDVITVEEETENSEISDLMLDNKVGAIPVVDVEGCLVGIVSYIDVLREMQNVAVNAAE
jgi:acetoin utilization protein AcuB